MARKLTEKWPMFVDVLMEDTEAASSALHNVARRVGRGSSQDQDLMFVGRALLNAALRRYGPCGVPDWLKASCTDYLGRSLLHYAVCASDPTFARLLIRLGAGINDLDDDDASPLCMAIAERGSRACLETLLVAGADVKIQDPRGRGPLHIAAEKKNDMAAAVLMHYGSNPLCPDRFGVAPIHLDPQMVVRASSFIVNPELPRPVRRGEASRACCSEAGVHPAVPADSAALDDRRDRGFAGSFSSVTRWRWSSMELSSSSASTPDLRCLQLDESASECGSAAEMSDVESSSEDEECGDRGVKKGRPVREAVLVDVVGSAPFCRQNSDRA
jgi:hypothetical protein